MEAVYGLLLPFLGTTFGAACVFFLRRDLSDGIQQGLTGFAAGVMTAASIWSLLIPAIDRSAELGKWAFLPAVTGFWIGVLFLLALDHIIPHLHRSSGQPEGPSSQLRRTTMLVLAVTLHNIPEGMAVGVVCAGYLAGDAEISSLGVLALASLVIGPGIADAVMSIIREIPAAFDRLQKQLNGLAESLAAYLPMIQEWLAGVNIDWESLSRRVLEYAQALGSGIVSSGGGFIGGVVSGVSTFVIGLIFSFYILLQKEKLSRHGRQVIYGLLPLRQADRTLEILRLASWTFSSFLSGQCLEACILGTLFVAAMTIFRMPYALLVGVLIALTALIPIVGAFIGCAVGALLIAIDDPWKALWFIVLFLVLQQIEGNLIYPHVVGSSVGLPSIWVLTAVTLGGSLLGILGMLIFIPLCSVLYALFRDFVKRRLRQRGVPEEKWREAPPSRPEAVRRSVPPRDKKPKP